MTSRRISHSYLLQEETDKLLDNDKIINKAYRRCRTKWNSFYR